MIIIIVIYLLLLYCFKPYVCFPLIKIGFTIFNFLSTTWDFIDCKVKTKFYDIIISHHTPRLATRTASLLDLRVHSLLAGGPEVDLSWSTSEAHMFNG